MQGRDKNGWKNGLTQDFVKHLFVYDPETGVFTRRISRRSAKAGFVAGCLGTDGYWQISISKVAYRAHRLAWLYVHGKWPDEHIDHIDGNKLNNRIANLRDVPQSDNMLNIHRPGSANSTGYRGVYFDNTTGTYAYAVKVRGKQGICPGFRDAATAFQGYLLRKAIMMNEARQ